MEFGCLMVFGGCVALCYYVAVCCFCLFVFVLVLLFMVVCLIGLLVLLPFNIVDCM